MMRARYLLVLATSLMLGGCPKETAIWIEPGSTSERLVFRVSTERGKDTPTEFYVLNVSSCPEPNVPARTYWVLSASDTGPAKPPTRIIYGVAPEGYRSEVGPFALTPGCYQAAVVGTGRTKFLVGADGLVSEIEVD